MKRPYKTRTVILISFGLLVVIGASVLLYLNAHIEAILREQLEIHTEDEMDIRFRDISINLLSQSVGIAQIEVSKTDSGTLAWSASVESLFIKNLSLVDLLRGVAVKVDSVVLSEVDLFFHENSQNSVQKKEPMETQLKPKMPLQVGGILISSGKFNYDPPGLTKASGGFSFLLRDFQLDSLAAINLKSEFLNSQFNIRLDEMVWNDSLYSVRIGSIRKTFGDSVFIDSLSLSPNQSLVAFTQHFGWNKAMLELEVQKIKTNIDFSGFPDFIEIPFCSVNGSHLHVNKDNRWPFPDRITPLPQEILSGLSFKFSIDYLVLTEAEITINLIQESGKEASISIENMEATLTVQNLNEQEPAVEITASQSLMGKASANFSTTYRYGNNSPFEYSLEMENSNLKFMSDFLQKSIGIKIMEGRLDRLWLDMTGNKFASQGEVVFEYSDLALAAVNKKTGKEKKILNALANVLGSLVFWKDNPAHNEYRTGKFSIERDVRKGFIAQWFEGLEAGIVNIVAKIDPLKARDKSESKKKSDK